MDNNSLEKLMLIIGHRFPRFWFDLWVVNKSNSENVENMIISIVKECFNEFSIQEQLKIKELLKNG